ncbi:MAG: Tim44 domain-containing protein [Nitrospira sp.]|nr:Tim44 domain-containing protein [Nitrospira sp.]
MKFLWSAALAVGMVFSLMPLESDAKRLGGARSSGMQRNAAPDKPAQQQNATPAQQGTAPAATPAAAAGTGAAAAAAPKRSWMGPIAGLAAGLGLAALFSHLGWGEGLANMVMFALLAIAAVFVVRMLMRRIGGGNGRPALATASASGAPMRFDRRPDTPHQSPTPGSGTTTRPSLIAPDSAASVTTTVPADFDREGFERLAKMLFIRLQAANDRADLNDLRNFTTPELFAALRLDLQDRGDAAQTTDVVQVDARLVDFAHEGVQQVVSVRFTGLIREAPGAGAEPFDEIWHLVRPADDSRSWAIAGIQQSQ